jgi:hypothetical protein
MSAPDPFALGGYGTDAGKPQPKEPSERLRRAAAELAAAILRAIPRLRSFAQLLG